MQSKGRVIIGPVFCYRIGLYIAVLIYHHKYLNYYCHTNMKAHIVDTTNQVTVKFFIDKNLLFDGVSIEELLLCVS